MVAIKGFSITRTLYESGKTLVLRAIREDDRTSVIIKTCQDDKPSPDDLGRLENEYGIVSRIHSPSVIGFHSLVDAGYRKAIIMEDIEGITLDDLVMNDQLSLRELLSLSSCIVAALGDIHRFKVIHNDINPENIIVNRQKDLVRIIDFGSASTIQGEIRQVINPKRIDCSPAYISPEQTGRMNRSVDYRTDIYSFGIILYRLLSGKLPFDTDDIMGLIYSHIAVTPESPKKYNPDLPDVLSAIVMKLVAKNAEERYQSANGIKHDLDACLTMLEKKGGIEDFEIARNDIAEILRIPEKMYGREKEIAGLMKMYSQVGDGVKKVFFIKGPAGIGKSFLISELKKTMLGEREYFVSGKSDKLHKDVPYHAFIEAFRQLVRQVLTEDEERIAWWRKELVGQLGENAGIINGFIPEMASVTGDIASAVQDFSASELRIRVTAAFQQLISVCTRASQVFVIFLDDLQWADNDSIDLVGALARHRGFNHLFLIGAFRDTETGPGHPLTVVFDKLSERNVAYEIMVLATLSPQNIHQLIADTFYDQSHAVRVLGDIIKTKTGGNPFFVKKFLLNLYNENYISFGTTWQFDNQRIMQAEMTDNIVSLMLERIRRFTQTARSALMVASCHGSKIDLGLVAAFFGKKEKEVFAELREAIDEGMITVFEGTLRFAHDRIQESCYSLLEHKAETHYAIGKLMLASGGRDALGEDIFTIAHQLNLGRIMMKDGDERLSTVRLNLEAGDRAKKSAAFSSAHYYFSMALDLLPQDAWHSHYELALRLNNELCEAGYLKSNIEETEKYFKQVIENAKNELDKIRAYDLMIGVCAQNHKMREAIDLGLEALTGLGYAMPKTSNKVILVTELIKSKLNMLGKKVEDVENLPEMRDPKRIAIVRILLAIGEPSALGFPDFLPLVIFRIVNLSLRYGNSIYSPYGYITYGFLLCGALGDIETGYKFGRLAVDLVERGGMETYKSRVYFFFGYSINHWKNHLNKNREYLNKALKSGMESGDFPYASYALNNLMFNALIEGERLAVLKDNMDKSRTTMTELHQRSAGELYGLLNQFVANLEGDSDELFVLKGEYFDETTMVQMWRGLHQQYNVFAFLLFRMILYYLFGRYDDAEKSAAEGMDLLPSAMGMIILPQFHFYSALSKYALARLAQNRKEKKKLMASARRSVLLMRTWARTCPENYANKYHLMKAEEQALRGNREAAVRFYNLSISRARENGFIHEEAIACERAAEFFSSLGMQVEFGGHIQTAYALFRDWNAAGKVRQLENMYPQNVILPAKSKPASPTVSDIAVDLDIDTILKATRAISSEIYLEKLLSQLLGIVMENAGAQHGLVILEKNGELYCEAESFGREPSLELKSILLEESRKAPLTVINYVKRTKDPLIVNDALDDPVFGHDDCVIKNRIRSVLCCPLVRKQSFFGLIYLENNVTSSVFTKDRLELVRILSLQAAISIENSLLFEKTLQTEQALQQQYEKIERQYEEMETINEELEVTLNQLSDTHKELERESELLSIFKKFADTSGQGLLMADIAHRVTYANAAFKEMVGQGGRDLEGADFRLFYHESIRLRLEREILPTVIEKGQWLEEIRLVARDGSLIPVLQNIFLIRDNLGKPHYIASVSTDITGRKKLEEEQSKAAKIESLEVFAGGIAHDFNNYLTVMMGNLSLLAKENLRVNACELLDEVLRVTDRAKELTQQLLAFSKSGAPVKKIVAIKNPLMESAKLALSGSGVRVEFQLKEHLRNVEVDEGQISQVIHNIILNARQAMEEHGTIRISAENITLPDGNNFALAGGPYIIISISDQGSGIDPEHMNNIFDPYFSTKKGGSGLGLSVAYSIMKKHEGLITVDSIKGRGTTFCLYLPASQKQSGTLKQRLSGKPKKYSGRLLLMDDDPSIRAIARKMFSSLGFEVTTVHNGEDLVIEYKQGLETGNPYALAVLDLTIPGRMGGKETIQALKEIDPFVHAVVSSGYANDPLMANYADYGFAGAIAKPYRLEDIEKMLEILF